LPGAKGEPRRLSAQPRGRRLGGNDMSGDGGIRWRRPSWLGRRSENRGCAPSAAARIRCHRLLLSGHPLDDLRHCLEKRLAGASGRNSSRRGQKPVRLAGKGSAGERFVSRTERADQTGQQRWGQSWAYPSDPVILRGGDVLTKGWRKYRRRAGSGAAVLAAIRAPNSRAKDVGGQGALHAGHFDGRRRQGTQKGLRISVRRDNKPIGSIGRRPNENMPEPSAVRRRGARGARQARPRPVKPRQRRCGTSRCHFLLDLETEVEMKG